jgi:hypothetical protein
VIRDRDLANLVVRELPEGLASACYDMRWIGEFTGYAAPDRRRAARYAHCCGQAG